MSMLLDHKVSPRKLLVVLPQLYKNLQEYPISLCHINSCGVPALQPYFLDPFRKETSPQPYGIDVAQSFADYVKSCDQDLKNLYLKNICTTLAESLKRQRGNQYGFGNDPFSSELVCKNLSPALMDDGDFTTTKSVENVFGNLVRKLKKAGSKGFSKATDELMI